jgi:Na+-driven multidrug efflux pump
MTQRNTYLTSKAFRIYLGASILTALSSMLGNIVDGMIVSNIIDHDAMSAVSLSRPLIQFYYTFHLLFGLGGSLLVAYALGKGDKRRANATFTIVTALTVAFSVVMALLWLICPDAVVGLMCSSEEVYPYALDYMKPVLWGAAAYMFSFFLGTYTTISGAPRLVSMAMIVDNIVNLCLDFVFIKLLDMGVAGSSYASTVGHVVGIMVMLSHYAKGKSAFGFVRFSVGEFFSTSGRTAKSGAPFAIASICLTFYMYSANMIIQDRFGADGIYIFSLMLSLLTFYNFFLSGACNTLQSLGALLVGLGDMVGLRMSVNAAFKFLISSSAVCCVILWAAPSFVCRLFGCPDNLLAECCYATRIYAMAFVFFCVIYLLMVNYKLLSRQALSTFLSFALSLTVIPVMWAIAVGAPSLIWWSNLIAYVIVFAVLFIWSEAKREDGESRITLLPTVEDRPTLDFSIPYSAQGLETALGEIDKFLNANGVEGEKLVAAKLSSEELIKNIIDHNESKRAASTAKARPYIDIRVRVATDSSLSISLHDDGTPFNPTDREERADSYGLKLATAFGQELSYKYMFGQNMTIIKVC